MGRESSEEKVKGNRMKWIDQEKFDTVGISDEKL